MGLGLYPPNLQRFGPIWSDLVRHEWVRGKNKKKCLKPLQALLVLFYQVIQLPWLVKGELGREKGWLSGTTLINYRTTAFKSFVDTAITCLLKLLMEPRIYWNTWIEYILANYMVSVLTRGLWKTRLITPLNSLKNFLQILDWMGCQEGPIFYRNRVSWIHSTFEAMVAPNLNRIGEQILIRFGFGLYLNKSDLEL